MRIVEGLEQCLEECPLDHVRIEQLCERAQVSRSTFYRYFTSKYDVPEWLFAFKAQEHSRALGVTMGWRDSNERVLGALLDRRLLFSHAMHTRGVSSFKSFAARDLTANLSHALFECHYVKKTPALSFQIEYTGLTIPHMVCSWFALDMPYPPEVLLDYLDAIVPEPLYQLVENLVNQPRANRT